MSIGLTGAVGVGAAALGSVLAYAVTFVQIRRRFPERWRSYAIQFLLSGASAITVGIFRDTDPVLLASAPMLLLGVGLLAGKGSVAVLIHDPADQGEMPEETKHARKRFAILLTVLIVVGGVVYMMNE